MACWPYGQSQSDTERIRFQRKSVFSLALFSLKSQVSLTLMGRKVHPQGLPLSCALAAE